MSKPEPFYYIGTSHVRGPITCACHMLQRGVTDTSLKASGAVDRDATRAQRPGLRGSRKRHWYLAIRHFTDYTLGHDPKLQEQEASALL